MNLADGASVGTLNANAPSHITGEGRITRANVNTSNVTIDQTPTTTTVADGVSANVGGQQTTGTSTSGSSGGSGGSSGGGGGGGGGGDTSKSSKATVTSGTFSVSAGGTANETIIVQAGLSKADLLAGLTKGEANQTWNDTGITDPVENDNILIVTAQNGAPWFNTS